MKIRNHKKGIAIGIAALVGIANVPIVPADSDILGLPYNDYLRVRTELLDKSNEGTITPQDWQALTTVYDYEIKEMHKRGDNVFVDVKGEDGALFKLHPYIRVHKPEKKTKKRSLIETL